MLSSLTGAEVPCLHAAVAAALAFTAGARRDLCTAHAYSVLLLPPAFSAEQSRAGQQLAIAEFTLPE